MHIKRIACLLAFLAAMPLLALAQQADTSGYKLVWADEFNTDGPVNSKSWKFEEGFKRNNEAQWYQPQNAVCRNGMLVITAQKVHQPNPNYIAGSKDWRTGREHVEYTSASVNTIGLHQWQYGRFVMRGRIPTDDGLWPAFWTLGVKGEWPSNGEIDIMEYYRNMLLANIACGTATAYKAKWYSVTTDVKTFGPGWSKQFHIWRMDWDEKEINLYVDDKLLNRVPLTDLVNRDAAAINPFKQPHYILLNLAIGGDNGGDPSKTPFPQKYEIDYVRVYQRK